MTCEWNDNHLLMKCHANEITSKWYDKLMKRQIAWND
jgi:hypothetical protein